MTSLAVFSTVVVLTNAFGRLSVDAHGARVVSYVPRDGAEVFATLSDGTGGMPLCWPWFGEGADVGARRHGVARYEDFRIVRKVESPDVSELELALDSSPSTKAAFAGDFSLSAVFRLGETLSVTLKARNTGQDAFAVTEAFHPYFAVAQARTCRVEGPFGAVGVPCDGSHRWAFSGSGKHRFALVDPDGGRRISFSSSGDSDLVVWNPGPKPSSGAKITSRLGPDDWRRFVCVENGTFEPPAAYRLAPGAEHALSLEISARTENPYGIAAHLAGTEFAGRRSAFGLMQAADIGMVRCDFSWKNLEKPKGNWNFDRADAVLADAKAAGLTVLPILDYFHPDYPMPHKDQTAWRRYVRKVVERYAADIPAFEVWNEQNLGNFCGEKASATNYLPVLASAYEEIKAVDPALKVVVGGYGRIPLDYIEELYKLGGGRYFDVMNVHPYTRPFPPEGRTDVPSGMDVQLEELRVLMAKYGDGQKPIWVTETGCPTHEARFPDGDILKSGLAAADPEKKAWRTLYVPTDREFRDPLPAELAKTMLPPDSTLEVVSPEDLPARLAAGDVDLVLFPFNETYSTDAVKSVRDFVARGGTLAVLGGIPMRRPMTLGTRGDIWGWNPAADPEADRKTLRICLRGRKLTDGYLKPGDRLVLLPRGEGKDSAGAAVYKFDSDMKGAIVVSALLPAGHHGGVDDRRSAYCYARMAAIALAEGVERFCPYELRSTELLPTDKESRYGLVRNNFVPKLSYLAYSFFTAMRPPGSVRKALPWRNGDGVYFPQWRRPADDRRCEFPAKRALGRDAGMVWHPWRKFAAAAKFSSGEVRFFDFLGEEIFPEKDGAGYHIEVSDAPVYFAGAELLDLSLKEQ